MIVKMSKATIVMTKQDVDSALVKLRKLGLLHIKHLNIPSCKEVDLFEEDLRDVDKVLSTLGNGQVSQEDLTFPADRIMIKDILCLHNKKRKLLSRKEDLENKLSWFKEWGKVSLSSLRELKEGGVYLKLYKLNKEQFKVVFKDKLVFLLRKERGIFYTVFVSLDKDESLDFSETEFTDEDFDSLNRELKLVDELIQDINSDLKKFRRYRESFKKYRAYVIKQIEFYKVRSGLGVYGELCCLQGFLPAEDAVKLKVEAKNQGWAFLLQEPDNLREVPTLIRNPRWVNIIKPVFKFMGTIPGYAEFDISLLFLIFLTLFFAILIGDAGYGVLFLVATFLFRRKYKDAPGEIFSLMYVFSTATIIWGLISGTWFGSEQIAALPFLHRFVIHRIDSFVSTNQGFLMFLCFVIGAIHLTIAHSLLVYRHRKSFLALAHAGWILVIWSLFFLAGKLVINRLFPPFAGYLLVMGVLLILLFAFPSKNILKSVALSLGDIPLKLISSFSDIVSYIRLFAVGYATVIVASSFNNMAMSVGLSNFIKGLGFASILFFGHSLNIILGLMAIIVHGVRLNMLEFSGHLGMEWSGVPYQPFRE